MSYQVSHDLLELRSVLDEEPHDSLGVLSELVGGIDAHLVGRSCCAMFPADFSEEEREVLVGSDHGPVLVVAMEGLDRAVCFSEARDCDEGSLLFLIFRRSEEKGCSLLIFIEDDVPAEEGVPKVVTVVVVIESFTASEAAEE